MQFHFPTTPLPPLTGNPARFPPDRHLPPSFPPVCSAPPPLFFHTRGYTQFSWQVPCLAPSRVLTSFLRGLDRQIFLQQFFHDVSSPIGTFFLLPHDPGDERFCLSFGQPPYRNARVFPAPLTPNRPKPPPQTLFFSCLFFFPHLLSTLFILDGDPFFAFYTPFFFPILSARRCGFSPTPRLRWHFPVAWRHLSRFLKSPRPYGKGFPPPFTVIPTHHPAGNSRRFRGDCRPPHWSTRPCAVCVFIFHVFFPK